MLIKMSGPTGNMEKIREEDVQHYLDLGYKRVVEPETVELMSPAGRVAVPAKEIDEYLKREGWSRLEDDASDPEPDPEPVKDEDDAEACEVEEPEPELEISTPAEDQIPTEPDPAVDAEACDSVEEPEQDEAAEAQMEG